MIKPPRLSITNLSNEGGVVCVPFKLLKQQSQRSSIYIFITATMPRWTFELAPNTLTKEEKRAIAEKVTDLYVNRGVPAFFVNVFFHENGEGNFYSGGKTPPDAVFFHIDHAIRKLPDENERTRFISEANAIVRPIFDPKGIKWESNIYEHPRENWRINGMIPPVKHPEIYKQWFEKNEAIYYEGA